MRSYINVFEGDIKQNLIIYEMPIDHNTILDDPYAGKEDSKVLVTLFAF